MAFKMCFWIDRKLMKKRKKEGEADRRKIKRDREGKCDEQVGVGKYNLKLLDGIKELVMQESLYWLQYRLEVVGFAFGSYYIIYPLMKFLPHWQVLFTKISFYLSVLHVSLCMEKGTTVLGITDFLSPFPSIQLTLLISLAAYANHVKTTHTPTKCTVLAMNCKSLNHRIYSQLHTLAKSLQK